MANIAERLRQGMELRNLKQVDIIEKTGINKGALSSYLSGKYSPKQNNIYLLAKALNVNEAWLMGHDVPMERINQYHKEADNALTTKDERDISKKLHKLMDDIRNQEDGPLYYNGEEMDETSLSLLENALRGAMEQLKIINKEKYSPNKNKK